MARPVRTSHTATANLLRWSEESRQPPDLPRTPSATSSARQGFKPVDKISSSMFGAPMTKQEVDDLPPSPSAAAASRAATASRQGYKPVDNISSIMLGAPMSKQEADDINKRKYYSDSKLREFAGSGIFEGENGSRESEPPSVGSNTKTSVKISQKTTAGTSQISFATQETPSPKKPTSLTEVAKQRELSGSLVREEILLKTTKEISETKIKELTGSDIFGPPPEAPARPRAPRNEDLKGNVDFAHPKPRTIHTSVKVSNPAGGASSISFSEEPVTKPYRKINEQKFQELTGNGIFKEAMPGKSSPERILSEAKRREMSGSNIFSDGTQAKGATSRDYYGGSRQPPGGSSTLTLL
ncbi:uncharacterized protein LOC144560165 [Carex rostrata]